MWSGVSSYSELVGKPGVGIAADRQPSHVGQLFEMRSQLIDSERAVQPHAEQAAFPTRSGMHAVSDGVVERLGCLSGERTPALVGDRPGHHHRYVDRHFGEHQRERVQCRFRVQRVECGLDQ